MGPFQVVFSYVCNIMHRLSVRRCRSRIQSFRPHSGNTLKLFYLFEKSLYPKVEFNLIFAFLSRCAPFFRPVAISFRLYQVSQGEFGIYDLDVVGGETRPLTWTMLSSSKTANNMNNRIDAADVPRNWFPSPSPGWHP